MKNTVRKKIRIRIRLLPLFILAAFSCILAQEPPAADPRLSDIRHLDLTYNFPNYQSKDEWIARGERLRKQILVSAGLWPMPHKDPIKATSFAKVDREDYTVEKVYFESHPGFYVTGNLYRPKKITGKHPAVLCPHGHWTYGRFENSNLNSGPARAANFARQGYLAFSYDMVGYGDSSAISHRFANHNITGREALWGVNLLGLQLWNSIRSLDFLLTIPEVDPERIAITGESGGGTQTFLLMAVDQRIKAAAPVNMISFHMQGGSLCENAPNLRIGTNNVEFGALMAPRPLFLVSATGDWTKNTLTKEYPAIRTIYQLFGAEDKVAAVQMDAPHNYNQDSREAVYGSFAHWLTGKPEKTPIKERGGGVVSLSDLMVFFGRPRPANELTEAQLSTFLIGAASKQLAEGQPSDDTGLNKFREVFGTALRYSLMAEYPEPASLISSKPQASSGDEMTKEDFVISRSDKSDRVTVTLWKQGSANSGNSLVLLITPDSTGDKIANLAGLLMKNGYDVAHTVPFSGGRQVPANIRYFTTYNRTDEALRVQDILTAIAFLKKQYGDKQLNVVAQGQAGLSALLARGLAPKIERMVIDAGQFETASDEEFVRRLPIPGIRRAGDFSTAVTIAPLTPLLIHNTGGKFGVDRITAIYRRFGRIEDFKTQSTELTDSSLINWLRSK
jgi:hypothetical protein